MTANDEAFRSITGQMESAEPSPTWPQGSMAPPTAAGSTNKARPPSSQSENGQPPQTKHQALNGSGPLAISGSPSAAGSPLSSRDTSPSRPSHRQPGTSGPLPKAGLRSRKSSTDVSPNRSPGLAGSSTTVPSAAAIQRALSTANIPNLPPISVQDSTKGPRPQKSASATASGDSTPHWPISPRLKSPPPSSDSRSRSRRNSLRNQAKKPETSQSTPAIVVQSSSPASSSRIPVKDEGTISDPEEQPLSMKVSSRGASGAVPKLETVQEASLPSTPGFDVVDADSQPTSTDSAKSTDEERRNTAAAKVTEDLSTKPPKTTESGSDSGANKNEGRSRPHDQRAASAPRPRTVPSKASFSSLSTVRSRTEAPSKNMTVETETVPSIAQPSIGGNQDRIASGRGDPSGSLRLKPSNETIRPKKERQKPKRKAPSINSGTASSKADVFEAKVASAVDEAESSDSDETFVYESNPPEPQPHRSRQHHSRTPSMTSINSLVDPRAAARDAHKNPGKKSSMKFANNPYNNPNSDPDNERADGAVRHPSNRVGGTGTIHHPHHIHIGRHGHARGPTSHPSLFDSDSTYPQSSRGRVVSSRQSSQPNSPKFHSFRVGNGNSKKNGEYSAYDINDENAADDERPPSERTPLIGTIRNQRRGPARRPNSASVRHLEHHRHRNGGWCRGFASCLVFSILILVLIFSAVGLVFSTTKPLYDVHVREIQNVVASQEELMLDMLVEAVNPNVVGVSIADMDLNIFAKSKHVGSDRWWREHGGDGSHSPWMGHVEESHDGSDGPSPRPSSSDVHVADGIDEGTDPIEDPEIGEPRTMLLGRVSHFDSPLNFEPAFLKRHPHHSLGELRLTKPGNKTEAGGTERWEEVLQHPFELILRGVLKYQLSLSTKDNTIPITASYYYDPDEEKKKLKAATAKVGGLDLQAAVTSKPWGRWDVRGRRLL